jgi:cell division protease FtsH
MNQTVKTILLWALILVLAVGLWNFVEHGSAGIPVFSLTDLITKVNNGEVAEVRIDGSSVTGKLRQTGQTFRSTIPVAYHAIYEQLIAAKVKVTVTAVDRQSGFAVFMSWVLPVLVAFGVGWQCARWSHRRGGQPPITTA